MAECPAGDLPRELGGHAENQAREPGPGRSQQPRLLAQPPEGTQGWERAPTSLGPSGTPPSSALGRGHSVRASAQRPQSQQRGGPGGVGRLREGRAWPGLGAVSWSFGVKGQSGDHPVWPRRAELGTRAQVGGRSVLGGSQLGGGGGAGSGQGFSGPRRLGLGPWDARAQVELGEAPRGLREPPPRGHSCPPGPRGLRSLPTGPEAGPLQPRGLSSAVGRRGPQVSAGGRQEVRAATGCPGTGNRKSPEGERPGGHRPRGSRCHGPAAAQGRPRRGRCRPRPGAPEPMASRGPRTPAPNPSPGRRRAMCWASALRSVGLGPGEGVPPSRRATWGGPRGAEEGALGTQLAAGREAGPACPQHTLPGGLGLWDLCVRTRGVSV